MKHNHFRIIETDGKELIKVGNGKNYKTIDPMKLDFSPFTWAETKELYKGPLYSIFVTRVREAIQRKK